MNHMSDAQRDEATRVTLEAVAASAHVALYGKATELTQGGGNVNVEYIHIPRPLQRK